MGAAGRFARLLGQGLSLAVLRRPRSRLQLAGFGLFILAWLLATLAFAVQDGALRPAPRVFEPMNLWVHAGFGAALLVASWIVAHVLRRPAAWLTLACLAMLAALPWAALDMQMKEALGEDGAASTTAAWLALHVTLAAVAMRIAWVVGDGLRAGHRLLAGVLFALLLAGPWAARAQAWVWSDAVDLVDTAPAKAAPHPHAAKAKPEPGPPPFDVDAVLDRQPAMIAARVDALAPQVPGQVDLFAIGFAGDGNEGTFRNEVEYLQALLPQRFGAEQRVLALVNHPGTIDTVPIASLTNLRAALAGVGARMDREEDILWLFLTSHGSPEHELAVDMPPLPLRQIDPRDLRDALDEAGIRWRVVVVSACYSGGFIKALQTPETLVITAARADRPSFGCGVGSEITWFGKAFLAQALNETTDFREAYTIAARRVRAWEQAEGEQPSLPQIWGGSRIDAQLARWREGLVPGAPVAFKPAVRAVVAPPPPPE
jgi:hypothetical protein